MPGPPPKDPKLRQRRNKTATRATMVRTRPPRQRAPRLPDRDWHPLTRAWWSDVWGSPMAGQFLEVDRHALLRLAVLVDLFWRDPTKDLAAEIRLEQQAFGLTPIDRRRLQWAVQEETETRRVRTPPPAEDEGEDPRKVLKMVASR